MRHAVLLGPLVARAGVEGDEHGQRARAGQRDAVDRQLVGGTVVVWMLAIARHDIRRAARSALCRGRGGTANSPCMQALCRQGPCATVPLTAVRATDIVTAPQADRRTRRAPAACARRVAERQRRGAHAAPRRAVPPRDERDTVVEFRGVSKLYGAGRHRPGARDVRGRAARRWSSSSARPARASRRSCAC